MAMALNLLGNPTLASGFFKILQNGQEPPYPLEVETEGYKEVLATCEV